MSALHSPVYTSEEMFRENGKLFLGGANEKDAEL